MVDERNADLAPIDPIVQRIREADFREALAMCAREHGAAVGGLCMALLGDQTEAEEAVVETLLAAHDAMASDAMPRFEAGGPSSVYAWLVALARRMCARRLETRSSGNGHSVVATPGDTGNGLGGDGHPTSSPPSSPPEADAGAASAAGLSPNGDVAANSQSPPSSPPFGVEVGTSDSEAPPPQRAAKVRQRLARLKPTEREAVLLHYQAGLSFGQVAAICGIEEFGARKRISRALLRLRAQLKERRGSGQRGFPEELPSTQK